MNVLLFYSSLPEPEPLVLPDPGRGGLLLLLPPEGGDPRPLVGLEGAEGGGPGGGRHQEEPRPVPGEDGGHGEGQEGHAGEVNHV